MSHDTCRSSVGLTPDSTRTVNSVAWRRSRQPVNRIVRPLLRPPFRKTWEPPFATYWSIKTMQ